MTHHAAGAADLASAAPAVGLPSAYFVVGPAGSGKSTVSKAVARAARAAYVDKDTVATGFTERLLEETGNDPHERDNNAYYQAHVLPLEYDTILRVCGDNLAVGTSVVLDAPFGRYLRDDDFLVSTARRLQWPAAHLVVVHVVTTGPQVRERLGERGLARDAWKLGHWDQFWPSAAAAPCAWAGATHVTVDNSGPVPDLSGLGLGPPVSGHPAPSTTPSTAPSAQGYPDACGGAHAGSKPHAVIR